MADTDEEPSEINPSPLFAEVAAVASRTPVGTLEDLTGVPVRRNV